MTYNKKRKFPMKEGTFIKKFMKEFEKDCSCWKFKTHGEPMQTRGIPDVLICYHGLFISIEFKIMRSGGFIVTPYQEHVMKKISDAKGLAFVVWFDERNGEVGIGTRRFENEKKAIEHLKNILSKVIPVVVT